MPTLADMNGETTGQSCPLVRDTIVIGVIVTPDIRLHSTVQCTIGPQDAGRNPGHRGGEVLVNNDLLVSPPVPVRVDDAVNLLGLHGEVLHVPFPILVAIWRIVVAYVRETFRSHGLLIEGKAVIKALDGKVVLHPVPEGTNVEARLLASANAGGKNSSLRINGNTNGTGRQWILRPD